jgi:signal transduction histidine kinase
MREAEAQLIHDLRNAATVLRAAAVQLQENDDDAPAAVAEQLVEIIGRRSDMVLDLLQELGRLHEEHVQESRDAEVGAASQRVALAAVCREALERRAPDGTTVTLHVPDDAVAVGEPMRVVRILDNLLTNAFRYGGQHVTVSAKRDGSFVALEVHDDGPGVPREIETSLFDAHVRGPRSETLGGSGLGLAIVRELCATMGGTVSYRHRAGASFTVTLPAAPDSSPGGRPVISQALAEETSWSPSQELVDALAPTGAEGPPLWRSRLSSGKRSAPAA